jgi:hypothetical protein
MRRVLVLTLAGAVTAAGAFALAQAPASQKPAPAAKTAQPAAAAKKRVVTPPIPNPGFAPPRPLDTMRAIYDFAAQHPEVLKFVPCYCGCESSGHPHNESCFVKSRDAQGNVREWDTHGYG